MRLAEGEVEEDAAFAESTIVCRPLVSIVYGNVCGIMHRCMRTGKKIQKGG